jgi:hypothetical protein
MQCVILGVMNRKETTIMIQNTMQPIILLIAYLSAATLLILARAMQ